MVSLFMCKCLNIILESDKIEDNFDISTLELTAPEQRDIFFSEKLVLCTKNGLKTAVTQPALVGQRNLGRWQLSCCLACGQNTHAVLSGTSNIILIPKAILTTQERINSLRKSKNFSPVFNLLVPEVTNDVEMKENMDTNNTVVSSEKKPWQPPQQVATALSQQLSRSLQAQLEAVEETVRQFREQKYAEYEAYRERAHRDHKILSNIVSKARASGESDLQPDNGPSSPQLPPLQRRRLSSAKETKKLSQVKPNRDIPPEEDSLDAEDIFDLEGADSHHNMASDQDYCDSDPEDSNDEGIQVCAGADVARSLPVNIAAFPDALRAQHHDLDDEHEPQDIAASIKALARSVHGDPFELPRPRFSTQI